MLVCEDCSEMTVTVFSPQNNLNTRDFADLSAPRVLHFSAFHSFLLFLKTSPIFLFKCPIFLFHHAFINTFWQLYIQVTLTYSYTTDACV